mmetsp:Transcript_134961/g.376124  ORF Transcript_134961/g.376124 Transcript_134961/m.376124 type:complete len:243 (-) Transcript_134961:109-837(-)
MKSHGLHMPRLWRAEPMEGHSGEPYCAGSNASDNCRTLAGGFTVMGSSNAGTCPACVGIGTRPGKGRAAAAAAMPAAHAGETRASSRRRTRPTGKGRAATLCGGGGTLVRPGVSGGLEVSSAKGPRGVLRASSDGSTVLQSELPITLLSSVASSAELQAKEALGVRPPNSGTATFTGVSRPGGGSSRPNPGGGVTLPVMAEGTGRPGGGGKSKPGGGRNAAEGRSATEGCTAHPGQAMSGGS